MIISVPLSFDMLYHEKMVWLTVSFDSYGPQDNILNSVVLLESLPINMAQLNKTNPELRESIDCAVLNNADTYWKEKEGKDAA